jgi:ABC-type amino acid transport substrate-binding protein
MNKIMNWVAAAAVGAGLALGAGAATAQGLIKEVKDRGTLRIGVAEGPPYQYPDPVTGDYIGLNIDLANEVAGILGVELEVVPATWATLVTGLRQPLRDPAARRLGGFHRRL